MLLRACQFEFSFPRPTLVMGIVNVTPDSFSDGGQFMNADAAVQHALELVEQGADILDIGGESTRPRATSVPEAEEVRRVVPVIEALRDRVKVPLSIDTMKPAVAEAAIRAGATIVNDVAANREDDRMWRVVAGSGAGYVCMHMKGTPSTMHLDPRYDDVAAEVERFFCERLERLSDCGVNSDHVIFDVGIGFGKTLEHNLELLAALDRFEKLRRPLLLGVSRKSFIGRLLQTELPDRLAGSLACACLAVGSGVQLIRAHDVAATVQAVRMTEAILARRTHVGKTQKSH